MTYKALFLDIDGTILKQDHTYAKSTKTAIENAQKKEIKVFLATGRPAHELDDLAKELNVSSLISYNGAYAVHKGDVIFNKPMEKQLVDRCIDLTEQHKNEMVLYSSKHNLFTSLNNTYTKNFIDVFQLRENRFLDKQENHSVYSITLINMTHTDPKLFKFDSDITITPVHLEGVEQCYDVIRKSVNKGEAIKAVLDHLNILPEEAIAFGDGMNDQEMLQTVGCSFAMENSNPDLFDYADYITTSVDNSGIYNGLKKIGVI